MPRDCWQNLQLRVGDKGIDFVEDILTIFKIKGDGIIKFYWGLGFLEESSLLINIIDGEGFVKGRN